VTVEDTLGLLRTEEYARMALRCFQRDLEIAELKARDERLKTALRKIAVESGPYSWSGDIARRTLEAEQEL
jgi:hypothetical protein